MSLPDEGWLDRPWPRRSCAMARKPFCARNSSCPSQASAFNGQPWRTGRQGPCPVLVVDLGAVFGGDGAHDSAPFKKVSATGSTYAAGEGPVASVEHPVGALVDEPGRMSPVKEPRRSAIVNVPPLGTAIRDTSPAATRGTSPGRDRADRPAPPHDAAPDLAQTGHRCSGPRIPFRM